VHSQGYQIMIGMSSRQGRRLMPAKTVMVTRTTFKYDHEPKRGPYQDTKWPSVLRISRQGTENDFV